MIMNRKTCHLLPILREGGWEWALQGRRGIYLDPYPPPPPHQGFKQGGEQGLFAKGRLANPKIAPRLVKMVTAYANYATTKHKHLTTFLCSQELYSYC